MPDDPLDQLLTPTEDTVEVDPESVVFTFLNSLIREETRYFLIEAHKHAMPDGRYLYSCWIGDNGMQGFATIEKIPGGEWTVWVDKMEDA